jgi:hypothetical protein
LSMAAVVSYACKMFFFLNLAVESKDS